MLHVIHRTARYCTLYTLNVKPSLHMKLSSGAREGLCFSATHFLFEFYFIYQTKWIIHSRKITYYSAIAREKNPITMFMLSMLMKISVNIQPEVALIEYFPTCQRLLMFYSQIILKHPPRTKRSVHIKRTSKENKKFVFIYPPNFETKKFIFFYLFQKTK